MTSFPAIAHVAITVTDLQRSTRWYTALLGSELVLDEDEQTSGFHHTGFALTGGQLFGLHAHTDTPAGERFDEHRTGLDQTRPRYSTDPPPPQHPSATCHAR